MKIKFCKKSIALALSGAMLLTSGFGGLSSAPSTVRAENCGGLEEVDVYQPTPEDVIQDPVLNWTIRSSLNSIKDHSPLTIDMVASKKNEYIVYESGSHPENFSSWKVPYLIHDLEGIQYAKYASMVDIAYSGDHDAQAEVQGIKSLAPLGQLTQVKFLKLYKDGISDISDLSTMVNLEELNLDFNYGITDISAVSSMSKLSNFSVQNSEIEDISAVAGLKNLQLLNVKHNKVTNLPDLSQLTVLADLNLCENQLTNEDLEKISEITSLKRLDISNNPSITDIRPLAKLINLEKDNTILPADANKDDLFAAIEVNNNFDSFNISKMTEDDLEYVQIALDSYNSLSEEQKTYIDTEMVEAARSNMSLVQAGNDPVYYEKYDRGGGLKPVLNRIDVRVVDRYGNPMSGIAVQKLREGYESRTETTDATGKVSFKHASDDYVYALSLKVKAEGYTSKPSEITYEVKNSKTSTINGKRATGYEQLQFVLVETDKLTDTDSLESTISSCSQAGEAYTYTDESYTAYENAMEAAKAILKNPDATQQQIDDCEKVLQDAYDGLTKNQYLTKLKIHVEDENGNTFTRPFKFQIYTADTKENPWNIWADGDSQGNTISYGKYTGNAYLDCSPSWKDNYEYEIACCNHEPHYFEKNIRVKIGVAADGTRYFKTVDGKEVDADFTIKKVAKVRAEGAIVPEKEIAPSGDGYLSYYIEKAQEYKEDEYTPVSYEKLTKAIDVASELLGRSDVAQLTYNQAGTDLKVAIKGLTEKADNLALEKAIDLFASYSADYYVTSSWEAYESAVKAAKEVFADANASQEEVDAATESVQNARKGLVSRGNKEKLKSAYEEKSKLEKSAIEIGWEDLQEALAEAKKVIDDVDASQKEVDAAVELINDAYRYVVFVENPVSGGCEYNTFIARVVDQNGAPVEGVDFVATKPDGSTLKKMTSDANGLIKCGITNVSRKEKITVTIDTDEYTTEDVHSFVIDGINDWVVSISQVDDETFVYGSEFTYTVETNTIHLADSRISMEVEPKVYVCRENPAAEAAVTVAYGSRILEKDVDYTVTYKDNTESGIAKVTITGNGNFRGSVTKSFRVYVAEEHKIIPMEGRMATHFETGITEGEKCEVCGLTLKEGTVIPKTTFGTIKLKAGKKNVKVSWKKVPGATGYQIRYSAKKNMKKSKTITVKSAKAVSKTVKKLKAKKRYYVKVQAYKTVGKKKIYSSWSSVKSVKTK